MVPKNYMHLCNETRRTCLSALLQRLATKIVFSDIFSVLRCEQFTHRCKTEKEVFPQQKQQKKQTKITQRMKCIKYFVKVYKWRSFNMVYA